MQKRCMFTCKEREMARLISPMPSLFLLLLVIFNRNSQKGFKNVLEDTEALADPLKTLIYDAQWLVLEGSLPCAQYIDCWVSRSLLVVTFVCLCDH